MGKIEGLPD